MLSKPSVKRHMNPIEHCRTTSNSQDIQPAKSPPRLKLKQDVIHIYGRLFLTPKKQPLKLGIYDTGSHRDGPWRIMHQGKSVRQRKMMVYEIPSRKNKNRHRRQQIYNPKRDSENSKSNKGFQKQKNWRVWNELGGRYLHRQEICICNR